MNKFTGLLGFMMMSLSLNTLAGNKDQLIKVDEYNDQLKDAFVHYQTSNYELALPALEEMAKHGEKRAQYIVGTMYLNAQGTEQDLEKSYAWLKVANEQKNNQWKKPLLLLDEKLSEDHLKLMRQEGDTYIAKYGVKAQHLVCRKAKTLGSKKRSHICSKSEIKKGYYYVVSSTDIENLALN
jgi:TPR repeat protein